MKKLLILAACAGLLGGMQAPVRAVAAPITQGLAYAGAITSAIGGTLWAVGHYGPANTIGTLLAAGAGYAGWYATDACIRTWITSATCPAIIASNPAVVPIVIAALASGALFLVRDSLLPSSAKELEKLGQILVGLGVSCATIASIFYLFNMNGYQPTLHLDPINITTNTKTTTKL